jgi:hypothetical protein
MINIKIPVSAVTGSGALSQSAVEFLKMGIQALGTNADGHARFTAHLNKFSYEQVFNGSQNLYDTIMALGGSVEFSNEGSEMQYFKAPIAYKTRTMPANYPQVTYTDENEVEQTYTYGDYHFHSGGHPYVREDEIYIYFAASVFGQRKAVGLEVKALMNDGCTLISKENYINAVPSEEV